MRILQWMGVVFLFFAPGVRAQGNVHVVAPLSAPETGLAGLQRLSAAGLFKVYTQLSPGLPALATGDEFGRALAEIGDLDGDGGLDLAVGLPGRNDGVADAGAVRIYRYDSAGRLAGQELINSSDLAISLKWAFGSALAPLGDFDQDGVPDLVVGGPGKGAATPGHIWLLWMNTSGGVGGVVRIGNAQAGFTGALDNQDFFGASVTTLGDLDGDGVTDLAVGAPGDDDGFAEAGATWLLFLNGDGTVRSQQKISALSGGFAGALGAGVSFGSALANLGDLDGDGVTDLAVGAPGDSDGGPGRGALWVLFLNANGSVKGHWKISSTSAGFPVPLTDLARFGSSCARLGDLDGDGRPEVAVGAPGDAASSAAGHVWLLSLESDGTVHAAHAETRAGLVSFGGAVARAADRDADGVPELYVGAPLTQPPPGDFTTVASALAAVPDGDTLLVKGGSYTTPLVISRPVTIQAEAGESVTLGRLVVQGLGSGEVVLRGLTIIGARFASNAGLIWLEDSILQAVPQTYNTLLDVEDSSAVVLLGVEALGRADFSFVEFDFISGQRGLWIRGNSNVQAYDCEFAGGDGEVFDCPGVELCGQSGGVGLRCDAGSFVFLSGCTVRGGAGTSWSSGFSLLCSAGGTGLQCPGTGFVLDCVLEGGAASGTVAPCNNSGADFSGNVSRLPVRGLALEVGSPTRNGVATMTISGPPSTPIFLSTSLEPRAEWLPSASGARLTGLLGRHQFVGVTDLNGQLTVSYPLPPLASGAVERHLYLQPSYLGRFPVGASPLVGKTGQVPRVLGRGSLLVQLDPSL